MSERDPKVYLLKEHFLSLLKEKISLASKPLRSLTRDDFEHLLIDAMESAADAGIIPDHFKLPYGIQLSQDDELFEQARLLFP